MADGKMGEAVAEQATGGRGAFDPDRVQMIDIDTLVLDPANVRTHPQRNIDAIVGSLQAFGQQKPVVVDADNVVRAGNGLVRAARLLGWSQVAAYTTGLGGSEAIAYAIADNRTAELSEWDDDGLAAQVEALLAEGVQVESWGWTEDELADLMADDYPTPDPTPDAEPVGLTLAERFIVPPFSVLDARQGYWQERKRAWLALGIESELGRGGGRSGL